MHELGNEEVMDRGAQGAVRSDENASFRVNEDETIRATEGVVTRSRGNASQPPRTMTTSRSQGAQRTALHEPQQPRLMVRTQLDLEKNP